MEQGFKLMDKTEQGFKLYNWFSALVYQLKMNIIIAGVCGSYGLPVLQVVGKFRGARNEGIKTVSPFAGRHLQ